MERDFRAEYRAKLGRPEWKIKRLAILERAGFKCERCRKSGDRFDIHHQQYIPGREPWEYPDELLSCLCRECHDEVTAGAPLNSESTPIQVLAEHLAMRFERIKKPGFDADRLWRWVKKLPDRRVHRPLMKFGAWLYETGTKDMSVVLAIVEDRCRRNPENPYAYYSPKGVARDCRTVQRAGVIAEEDGAAFKRVDHLMAMNDSRRRG